MNTSYRLAKSYWPRSGYDQANRSHTAICGAMHGRVVLEVELPSYQNGLNINHTQGCVVTDTMTLRVICNGVLSAITLEGKILWSIELRDEDNQPCENCSSPIALKDGACLVSLADNDSIRIYDQHGECIAEHFVHAMIDDSGLPPNITDSGHLVIGGASGDVFCIDGATISTLGDFGYDVVTPAIYPDNSLAIAGYYGTGFCRVLVSGEEVWKTDFLEADLLSTINKESFSAVGSLNNQKSAFFSSQGELIGTYSRASVFAEYSSEEWIALSAQYIAKLTLSGKEIWGYKLHDSGIGHRQPIVDNRGYVYLIDNGNLLCLDGEGRLAFKTHINTNAVGGLCCVSPGKMACVTAGTLVIID